MPFICIYISHLEVNKLTKQLESMAKELTDAKQSNGQLQNEQQVLKQGEIRNEV